jgi:DNA processing protein
LISEYGPGTEPQKQFFPARNRIISGLSLGVFVVEAGDKSGALITADFAMEQGRDVYALPGNINQVTSAGTNKLIRDGAKIVIETDDLIDGIRQLIPLHSLHQNRTVKTPELSGQESMILDLIRENPLHPEALVHLTHMPVSEINGMLTVLELKGLIEQLPGKNIYSALNN